MTALSRLPRRRASFGEIRLDPGCGKFAGPGFSMRLDLFLKISRLCLRRTVAQQLCEAGLVFLNGKPAKSSSTVKVGDEMSLRRRDRVLHVRILALPDKRQTSRSEAGSFYEVVSEEQVNP